MPNVGVTMDGVSTVWGWSKEGVGMVPARSGTSSAEMTSFVDESSSPTVTSKPYINVACSSSSFSHVEQIFSEISFIVDFSPKPFVMK